MGADIVARCIKGWRRGVGLKRGTYIGNCCERDARAEGQQAKIFSRLMGRGRGCLSLEECHNLRMPMERGDLER